MNATRILFPTDFSENSKAALTQAAALARDTGAKLLVVHVTTDADAYVDTGFGGYPIVTDQDELEAHLVDVMPADSAVKCEHVMLHGDPAAEIVDFAEREEVDMIVMGTHGRRGLTRLLMGSVAEAVVRGAKCPVLTVKQPEEVVS